MPLFRLFPLDASSDSTGDKDSDTKRVLRDMEWFILEDYVLDLLFLWQDEHKNCIRLLLQLPVTTFDLDRALVEILFSQIFRLPTSPLNRVYYGVLLIDLCRAHPESVPTQLGHAILRIFEQLHTLDVECFGKFVEWFSFHLNNFSFKWPWDIWYDNSH
jgi:nuclear cap-binding protein subunit 1